MSSPARSARARAAFDCVALTRVALTRVALTRVALTRVALTRVALARVALTRVAFTSLALTRVALTRVALTLVAGLTLAACDPAWVPPPPAEDCANTLDDDADGFADCADDACLTADVCRRLPPTEPVQRIQQLFDHRCGCHTGALAEAGLRLDAPFTATTVGVPSTLDPAAHLITPGDPDASLLYQKLAGTQGPAAGARMPPELPWLDAAELALVRGYIEAMR